MVAGGKIEIRDYRLVIRPKAPCLLSLVVVSPQTLSLNPSLSGCVPTNTALQSFFKWLCPHKHCPSPRLCPGAPSALNKDKSSNTNTRPPKFRRCRPLLHFTNFPTSRLPDFRTSRLSDFPSTRLPDFPTFGLPDFPTSGLPDFRTPPNFI